MNRFSSDIVWRMDQMFGSHHVITITLIYDLAVVMETEARKMNIDTNNITDDKLCDFLRDLENGVSIDWNSVLRRPVRKFLSYKEKNEIPGR